MSPFRVVSEPRTDLDIEAAFDWYENERYGLGFELLDELRATYDRIALGPFKYPVLRSGVRRALTKRFPYAVYFAVEGDVVVVVAVLHANRDPVERQRRRG